ncbi:hypothetical protein [Vreelandella aquamarina]|uniref:hypothetical protein n=1 Tax=Vreelandella aquamarina TaxID=77097 RepID=UPI001CC6EC80|nr:hypothetical protein [Halomonas aquamarina]
MADMQKAVWLWRETRHDFGDLAALDLVAYLVANEVRRWGGLVGHGGVENLVVDGVPGNQCLPLKVALRGAEQNRYYSVTPMHSAKANAFIEQEFIYDRITDELR